MAGLLEEAIYYIWICHSSPAPDVPIPRMALPVKLTRVMFRFVPQRRQAGKIEENHTLVFCCSSFGSLSTALLVTQLGANTGGIVYTAREDEWKTFNKQQTGRLHFSFIADGFSFGSFNILFHQNPSEGKHCFLYIKRRRLESIQSLPCYYNPDMQPTHVASLLL